MEIKTIAILGAGAIGGYVYWGLEAKDNLDICFIAEGDRADRLNLEGLSINGGIYNVDVKTPEEAKGVDLIIVALKYNSLKPSLDMIKRSCGDNTVVMSLMNGLDSEEIIASEIGMEHMIYSMIKIASANNDRKITFPEEDGGIFGVYIGQPDGASDHRLSMIGAVDNVFKDGRVKSYVCDDIISQIWTKFSINVAMNLPQTVIGCGIGAYRDSENVMYISQKLLEELKIIADKKNIIVEDFDIYKTIETSRDSARYSTLQDIDAGRETEVDMFAGAIVRLGNELDIPTPFADYTLHAIKALEEKNAGRFDYN